MSRFAAVALLLSASLGQPPVGREQAGGSAAPVAPLVPRTTFDGPALQFEFPGLEIGVAEYDEGPTGATVFYFPSGATGVVDVRGGWPGTVNTDGLRLGYEDKSLDAVTLSGGSYYGLAVSGGVADEIRQLRDRTAPPGAVPGRGAARAPAHVVSAILFDLAQRFNTIAPDAELGRAAFRARRSGWFPLGARGAGRMSSQGGAFGEREKGGQGAAVRQVGATRIAVFAVLNGGAVIDRAGNVVVCNHPAAEGLGRSAAAHIRRLLQPPKVGAAEGDGDDDASGFSRNTNLFLVVTNQRMSFAELQRLAVQVHTSLGRAIQPFNTRGDGDVLYAASTQEVTNGNLSAGLLNLHAAETAWDAVLAAPPARPERPGNRPVSIDAAVLDRLTGEYEFGANAVLQIRRAGQGLVARAIGARPIYGFALNADAALQAESATTFYQQTRFEDRLQFLGGPGRATGLIFNPGVQHLSARRVR